MLTSTITVPIYGKLSDLYGRKAVLLVAIGFFLLGSMASGQARTMNQLIAFRALQGIGAGGIQPVAITVIGDIFTLEERAKMQGVFGAVWAFAGLVGPIVGGFIVAAWSWRWIFYVNVPFGLLSAGMLMVAFREASPARKEHALDVLGAVLLAAAVVALLLGADGVEPALLFPVAIALTAVFLAVERRAPEAIVPLAMFRERTLAASGAISAVSGAAMLGVVTFVPLYAQGVLGASPAGAGGTIAPMAIGWPVASAVAARLIVRVGFRKLVIGGMLLVVTASVGLVYALHHGASARALGALAAAFGIGMGFANTAVVLAVQTSVTFARRGVATASTMFFRNIAGTVGVGAMGAVLAHALLANASARASGGARLVAQILGPDRASVSPSVLAAIGSDLGRGVTRVAGMIAALAACGAIVAFFFPRTIAAPGEDASPR